MNSGCIGRWTPPQQLPRLPYDFEAVSNFLSKFQVKDVVSSRKEVAIAHTNESIHTVFNRLLEWGVSSMPLYDDIKGSYVAFIDIYDIVAYAIENFDVSKKKCHEIAVANREFVSTCCLVFADREVAGPWALVHKNCSVQNVIDALANSSLSKSAVLDQNSQIFGVVTQSDIVNFLARITKKFSGLTNAPLKDLDLARMDSPSVRVHKNETLLEVVSKMRKSGANRAYVYSESSGKTEDSEDEDPIGLFFASHLKNIECEKKIFSALDTKIDALPLAKVVRMDSKCTLRQALMQFKYSNTKIIHLVDENRQKPPLIVTPSDILKAFASNTRYAPKIVKIPFLFQDFTRIAFDHHQCHYPSRKVHGRNHVPPSSIPVSIKEFLYFNAKKSCRTNADPDPNSLSA